MAENIEFIAAKDLPETDAAEVDVLCVDPATGEMKRKPGASLGGSKGLVIKMTTDNSTATSESKFTYNDNYDEIAQTLYEGGVVWIDMKGYTDVLVRGIVYQWMYTTELTLIVNTTLGIYTFSCTNGTWTPPTE